MNKAVINNKLISSMEDTIIRKMLEVNYGTGYKGVLKSQSDMEGSYYTVLASTEDIAYAENKVGGITYPTCNSTGLQVDVTVGTLLIDSDTFSADPDETKYCLITLVVDDSSKELELVSYEKTTGEYGPTPAGKTHIANLKEYSIVAAGSSMTEIQTWL